MIVCIPTKGRPKTATYRLFEGSGFHVFHFIEPQEFEEYDVPNKVNIKDSDKGVTWVRNFINNWARQNNHQFICVCDDDITQFGVAQNQKAIKKPNADALKHIFEFFECGDFAMCGINQRQFAWSEKRNVCVNHGKFTSMVMLNLQKISWEYRGHKEDLDFAMQCLDNRQNMVYFPKVFYSAPAIGSNAGGLHDWYEAKGDAKAAQDIVRLWPDYATIKEQFGRIDVKLDMKAKARDMGLKIL